MRECYYPLETGGFSNRRHFRGSIDIRDIGNICVSRMRSDSHLLRRTPSSIAKSSKDTLLFVIPTKGSFSYEHIGREGFVRPGDALLIKSSEPYMTACSDNYENICFEVDALKLTYRVVNIEDACGRTMRLDQSSKWFFKQTLGSMLDIGDETDESNMTVMNELSEFIVNLAVTNIGLQFLNSGSGETGSYRGGLRQRITAYILENLTDPEMTPQSVAAAHDISASYLHKLFHSTGTSVNRLIIERRLSMCMERLKNPALDGLTITEIAFQSGFSNAAHFSSRFRKRYGISPREARMGN